MRCLFPPLPPKKNESLGFLLLTLNSVSQNANFLLLHNDLCHSKGVRKMPSLWIIAPCHHSPCPSPLKTLKTVSHCAPFYLCSNKLWNIKSVAIWYTHVFILCRYNRFYLLDRPSQCYGFKNLTASLALERSVLGSEVRKTGLRLHCNDVRKTYQVKVIMVFVDHLGTGSGRIRFMCRRVLRRRFRLGL